MLVLVLFSFSGIAQKRRKAANELEQLAQWMCGSYNSVDQAKKDTSYLEISLVMVRIWPERTDGAWFYVEQAAMATLDKPYRQRVYHLEQMGVGQFRSSIYALPTPETFIGAQDRPEDFKKLEMKQLTKMPGCALMLEKSTEGYAGSTKKGACLNQWGEALYATSEVSITPKQMVSWDRGWNGTDEQVWGAENGGYIFVKTTQCDL